MGEESFFTALRDNYMQIIAVIFGTLNALSDGMHFGWSAPTIPLLKRKDSPIPINGDDVIKLEVYFMISGVIGLPITVFLANKLGRKKSVLVASSVSFIGWILIGFGDTVEYLVVARCLVGVASDVAFVCSPMYIAEIAHQRIRGFLAGIIYAMVLGGVLLIYVIAPYVSIRVPPIVGGCIILIQLIVFPFMPESPYYHLYKNREKDARKSLQRLRMKDDVDAELKELEVAVRRQKAERGRPQDLILIDSNRKSLMIMTVLNAIQHMVGFAAILMNLHDILEDAGATYISSNVAAIVFAAVMFAVSIGTIFVVDKFGRKVLYGISSIGSGVCLLIIAIFFHVKHSEVDVIAFSWIPLVFCMIFAAFFKFGIGVIPIVMTAELFPAKIKALGMTAADGIYVFFAGVSVYLYQIITKYYGLHWAFYMFSGVAFLASLLNVLLLPETKGKTLEEIQMMLKK